MKVLKSYFSRADDRGAFTGITQQPWAEVNFIETAANQVRGNHYHKETRELFFIIAGEIEVTVENLRSGEREVHSFTKGDIFIIEPYELHTFRTMTDAQWLNMLSQPMDQSSPDFHHVSPDQPVEK
ncbi:MAG: cupin domain-containing protein [Pyrinomonadaceae bacterium]